MAIIPFLTCSSLIKSAFISSSRSSLPMVRMILSSEPLDPGRKALPGAKLSAQILHEMKRRQTRYGLVTMCVGGGMGAAGIFERLD